MYTIKHKMYRDCAKIMWTIQDDPHNVAQIVTLKIIIVKDNSFYV